MEIVEIQEFLKLPADGKIGPKSLAAIQAYLKDKHGVNASKWDKNRILLGIEQAIYAKNKMEVGTVDGLIGEQTRYMRMLWEAKKADEEAGIDKKDPDSAVAAETNWKDNLEATRNVWPVQDSVQKYYGKVGENQTTLILPFPMKIAWEQDKIVKKFSIHEKVHDSAKRCFIRIANAYDEDARKKLGLDLWGGSLNVRKMRGSTAWSMHSWGIAIDFDPDRNQLKWGRDQARLAKKDAEEFWRIWEDEGWLSLGRARNYDWMHVQAARL